MAPSTNEKSKLWVFLRILTNILWTISLVIILASCSSGKDSPSNSLDSGSVLGTSYMSGLSVSPGGTLIIHGHDGSSSTPATGPVSVAVEPHGKFVYVANSFSNNISAYTIDGTKGDLNLVTASPFTAGTNPSSITVDPTGKFTYVANSYSSNVSAYTIDTTTGALTEVTDRRLRQGVNLSSSPWTLQANLSM